MVSLNGFSKEETPMRQIVTRFFYEGCREKSQLRIIFST
jgi:hypothetical protein